MNREQAQAIALNALTFIAADEHRLNGFMTATGIDQETLQRVAGTSGALGEVLGGVLDYLLANDALVEQFADADGLDPMLPARARAVLPGGDQFDWDG